MPTILGAEPRQIWMFIRHGARIPNAERMTELKELEDVSYWISRCH